MQAPGDFGFADAGAVQFPDFRRVYGRGDRATESFAVLTSLGQTRASSFAQNIFFELRKNCKQSRHGATSGRGQIQWLGQRDEADSEMLQFLQCRQQVQP